MSTVLAKDLVLLLFHIPLLVYVLSSLSEGGIICISEVIDISPSNLDSSLCFIQLSISHDVLCI